MEHLSAKVDLREGCKVYINKPLTWSSFSLVNKFRYEASKYMGVKKLKVGHAGTLDPLATGVMILCTGRATKEIEELQKGIKEYIADIRLGATTPSFDMETEVDALYPTEHITEEAVRTALNGFVGEIEQTPPIFSACKVDGKRAYDLARQGQEVELRSKRIKIYEIELIECKLPDIRLRVLCGKGTYIRSLARDIGLALGSGGYLTALQRTRVGDAYIEDCISVEDISWWLNEYALKANITKD